MASELDVRIYSAPNPAVSDVLISPRMRAIVRDVTELAEALYREEVSQRTGTLARDTHVSTEMGGVYDDRWIGVLTVGLGAARDYVLAHEFGIDTERNAGDPAFVEAEGAQDLNRVLEIMSVAMYL